MQYIKHALVLRRKGLFFFGCDQYVPYVICFLKTSRALRLQWMLLIPGTGNGKPGTGVWELVYSGNLPENSKWRTTRCFQTQILPLVRVEDKPLFKYCLGEAMTNFYLNIAQTKP